MKSCLCISFSAASILSYCSCLSRANFIDLAKSGFSAPCLDICYFLIDLVKAGKVGASALPVVCLQKSSSISSPLILFYSKSENWLSIFCSSCFWVSSIFYNRASVNSLLILNLIYFSLQSSASSRSFFKCFSIYSDF